MSILNNSLDVSSTSNWNNSIELESLNPGISTLTANNSHNSQNINAYNKYWENMNHNDKTDNGKGLPFRIMSYNILAQLLLESHLELYSNCSDNALAWDVRFELIFKEIMLHNLDIICLQELQSSHVALFSTRLQEHGYKYIYKQRTGIREDGCAIFYRSSKFDLIDHHSVEFRQPSTDILDRDNIGIIVKLRPTVLPSFPFVVCTTHLLYNPKRTDVRLAQMQVFLAEIDRFSLHTDDYIKTPQYLPVMITGDFNSPPDSPVIRLLSDGSVNFNQFKSSGLRNIAVTDQCQHLGVYLKRKKGLAVKDDDLSRLHHSEKVVSIDDSDDENELSYDFESYDSYFNRGHIKHRLNLKSVYDFIKPNGEREATTNQNEWVTVDYIFYGSGDNSNLKLLERYRLPTQHECTLLGSLPNKYFGSDHFSLAAKFSLYPFIPQSNI